MDKRGYNYFCLDLPLSGFGTFLQLYLSNKKNFKLAQANPGESRKIGFWTQFSSKFQSFFKFFDAIFIYFRWFKQKLIQFSSFLVSVGVHSDKLNCF